MNRSNQRVIKILKNFIWPVTLVIVVLLLRRFDFSKINLSWEKITALITVIIWPVTGLAGLLFFRKHLGNVINSLGTFKVGTQGVEMTFQNKLESAQQQLIESGSMFAQSKSAGHINIKGSKAITPYEQLLEIRDALISKIIKKAQEYNIETEDTSSSTICDKLKESGAITYQIARNFNALMDLTVSGNPSISQLQVNQVKELYNSFQL